KTPSSSTSNHVTGETTTTREKPTRHPSNVIDLDELPQDPVDRPRISQYNVNQRYDIRQKYWACKPCQPRDHYALRRWREMFFWVDDALVPWDFAFYTQGSYSMEDAELINENRIPINAYSEAFLCHMGISRDYFQILD
ncbi:hypothetical protein Tco_1398739, partial [Tanacetum coccineum]